MAASSIENESIEGHFLEKGHFQLKTQQMSKPPFMTSLEVREVDRINYGPYPGYKRLEGPWVNTMASL